MANIANTGNGTFVDGTDLTNLIAGFMQILNNTETLAQLDIVLPSGEVLTDAMVDAEGRFSIALPVFAGDNLFIARATSNLGNVQSAELLIRGIPVPEPTMFVQSVIGSLTVLGYAWRRQKRLARSCKH